MTTTYDGAYQSIKNELITYWAAADWMTLVGTNVAPEIRFYAIEKNDIPKTYFIRFQLQPVTDGQSSFRQTDGKRFAAYGNVIIQVFAPKKDIRAYERIRGVSMLLQKRFRKAIDCISFVNVRINDAPDEENFWRQNVIAEYRYDEIQA